MDDAVSAADETMTRAAASGEQTRPRRPGPREQPAAEDAQTQKQLETLEKKKEGKHAPARAQSQSWPRALGRF